MFLKPIPLHRSHRAESDGMFGFSNGLRMRKISHFEVSIKQGKKMVSGTHRVPRGTPIGCQVAAILAGRGTHMTHGKIGDDVAYSGRMMWRNVAG